ncbi:MAG TPA: DUF2520 domain-containing protein [Bacteroidota bacterium]|nr:DUF2520 domain-containing protein [Bacteroidota bacterium]
MKQHYHNICIVGAGRVGTALAVALHKRGHRICAVISHTRRSAQKLSRLVGSPLTSYSIRSMPVDCDVAIIAVPDGQIKIVAREIARLKRKSFASLLVVHTSGIHTAEILSPLAKKGAHTASIHPIQTFPAKAYRADLTNGIFYGIDASGKSVSEAKKLVAALGGNAIVVPRDLKPLYHSLCVFSSGHLVAVLDAVAGLAKKFKFKKSWQEVLGPLILTAVRNAFHESPSDALTGPIARGDIATVRAHLASLRKRSPELVALYRTLGLHEAEMAVKRRAMTRKTFGQMKRLLA